MNSLEEIPILQKPCTWGIEVCYTRMTLGESVDICSMVNISSDEYDLGGAVKESIHY
jgi:hypothetical protein